MINNRLLNEFKSDENSTVIIENISCEPDSCGQELLTISTKKILKPYEEVIKRYDQINKVLEVEGQLDLNSDQNYYTKLVGFICDKGTSSFNGDDLTEKDVLNDKYSSPTSHYIEEIKTGLSNEIEIAFNRAYKYQPHVIITIDKDYEELYRSYSTLFIKNSLGTHYTGVKIIFNNLKTRNSYPKIGICVIGDAIESYYDGIVKTEESTSIHIFCREAAVNLYIFEMIEMEKVDVQNTEVIITDNDGNSTAYTTDNCGKIDAILEYGKYTIKINNEIYDQTPIEFEITKDNTEFEIEAILKKTEQELGE